MTKTISAVKNKNLLSVYLFTAAASLALAAKPSAAAANSGGMLSEEDFLGDMPIVLSVTRLAQPVSEVPAEITVIDRHMIRALGVTEIAEIFRIVPGFQVGHLNNYTSAVTYHGLSDEYSRRMQVLVDGRSVYTPSFGGVEWADLPLAIEDIERIEVIRGPNAATYGANSFLGVISIKTRHPSGSRGTVGKLTRGDHATTHAFLRHGGTFGKLDYRVTVKHQEDDGLKDRHDSYRTDMLNLHGDYRLVNNDTLMFQLGLTQGPRDTGSNSTTDPHRQKDIYSHFQLLRWRHVLAPTNEFSIQFYHNYHRQTDEFLTHDLTGTLPPAILALIGTTRLALDYNRTAERFDVEFQHTRNLDEQIRLVWGASARLDEMKSLTFFGTAAPLKNHLYRLFANAEWTITRRTLLNAGAMMEKNDITGTDVSPRLALNHHLSETHTVRASVSRALRTPVLFEEKGDWAFTAGPITDQKLLSTGGLQPETITSVDVGLIGHLSDIGLSYSLRLYRDKLEDLISAFNSVAAFDLIDGKADDVRNRDHATASGVEFQVDFRPSPDDRIFFSYANSHISSSNLDVNYTLTVPRHTFSLLLAKKFPNAVEASLAHYKVGEMTWLGSGDYVPQYDRTDLRLSRTLRVGESQLEIAAGVHNLLNHKHIDFAQGIIFDKRVFLSLELSSL